MTTTIVAPTRSRIAATLFWRGVSITACAAVAVRWPADGLLLAMAAVGALAIGFGVYDLSVAVRLRPAGRWWILLLHGSLSIAFGVLSLVSLGLSRQTMALLFAGWLLLTVAAAFSTAVSVGVRRSGAAVYLALMGASALAIIIVLADLRMTALLLLYAGACVATLVGMAEVGLAQWLRRATGPQLDL